MTALHLAGQQPDPDRITSLAAQLTIHQFCQLIAHRFNLGPTSGEQTLELRFEHGQFRWAKLHTGRLGADDLENRA